MLKALTAAVFAFAWSMAAPIPAFSAADGGSPADARLLRVFLKDGSSLVSYGEPARVGDRIVFSMPTSAAEADLRLHLIDLPANRVDWERTSRYSDAARAARYLANQAAADYAELSNEVAVALDQVAATNDPAARTAIVEKARAMLADWPPTHYGYKQAEVQQMIGMLDAAIAGFQPVPSSADGFSLNFVTITPPPPGEPLLPRPTAKETIDQVMLAAKLTEEPSERAALLNVAAKGIERDRAELPKEWAASTTLAVNAQIERERNTDGVYKRLSDQMLALAKVRTRNADVHGLERLVAETTRQDQLLGTQRPDTVRSLLDALDSQLDAARKLRLARDQWQLQAPGTLRYRRSITLSLARLANLKPALADVKSLAGPSPATVAMMDQIAKLVRKSLAAVKPPEYLAATHALLLSATDLAVNAADIRMEATRSGEIARAWDASAAAAGSIMLSDRARADLQTLTRYPQLLQLPK